MSERVFLYASESDLTTLPGPLYTPVQCVAISTKLYGRRGGFCQARVLPWQLHFRWLCSLSSLSGGC